MMFPWHSCVGCSMLPRWLPERTCAGLTFGQSGSYNNALHETATYAIDGRRSCPTSDCNLVFGHDLATWTTHEAAQRQEVSSCTHWFMDECAGFTSDKLQEEKFRDVIGCVSQFDVLLKGVRLCEGRYWNVTWKGATATLPCCSGIQ